MPRRHSLANAGIDLNHEYRRKLRDLESYRGTKGLKVPEIARDGLGLGGGWMTRAFSWYSRIVPIKHFPRVNVPDIRDWNLPTQAQAFDHSIESNREDIAPSAIPSLRKPYTRAQAP